MSNHQENQEDAISLVEIQFLQYAVYTSVHIAPFSNAATVQAPEANRLCEEMMLFVLEQEGLSSADVDRDELREACHKLFKTGEDQTVNMWNATIGTVKLFKLMRKQGFQVEAADAMKALLISEDLGDLKSTKTPRTPRAPQALDLFMVVIRPLHEEELPHFDTAEGRTFGHPEGQNAVGGLPPYGEWRKIGVPIQGNTEVFTSEAKAVEHLKTMYEKDFEEGKAKRTTAADGQDLVGNVAVYEVETGSEEYPFVLATIHSLHSTKDHRIVMDKL